MKELEELVCSWEQGKQLIELNIDAESVFKWVHPYPRLKHIKNKRKYRLVKSYKIANRRAYPAYTLEELIQLLPEEYILARLRDHWYCISKYNVSEAVIYERTAIDACFNVLAMCALRDTWGHIKKIIKEEKSEVNGK